MSCATTGALIHYTIDGDGPDRRRPSAHQWTVNDCALTTTSMPPLLMTPFCGQRCSIGGFHHIMLPRAGRKHTYLNPDETILAAGSNGSGQLGDGTTTDRTNLVGVLNLTTRWGLRRSIAQSGWAAMERPGLGAMTPMASWRWKQQRAAQSSPFKSQS